MQNDYHPDSLEDTLVLAEHETPDFTVGDATDRLVPDAPPTEQLSRAPSAARMVDDYLRLPVWVRRHHQSGAAWRIQLHPLGGGSPVGLDVLGELIVGRGANSVLEPDLDLASYGAKQAGVSRHHAVFKPSNHSIDIMDLGSTNGTRINGLRLTNGVAYSLRDKDVISLGNLHFYVHIVGRQVVRA